MAKKDYYDVLGVSRSASTDQIKSAYRKLARQLHPDVTKNDAKKTEQFKETQEAYEVLSDAQKRKNYDEFGHAGVHAGPGGAPGADPFEAYRRAQQSRGGARSWQGGPGVSVEDFDFGGGGGGDFGSIFEQLFGAGGGRPRPGRQRARQQQRGADVEHGATLSFEQAARGTTLPLQINRDGKLETIDVKIPSGVRDGNRIRLKGRGQGGDPPGDLFIITHVLPHSYFRREDLDVHLDVPVSLYEAALGAKVDVPTLDGVRTIHIPPGTSSGAKLRIKGHGVVRGDEKGDQICILRIAIPRQFDEEDKAAIEKMQHKHPLNPRTDTGW